MKTAFRGVKEELHGRIVSGRWPPGSMIPNEVSLAQEFGCARATVNRAMRELADEGLIERKRKAGSWVRRSPLRQASFDIPIVRSEIERQGVSYQYKLCNRAEVAAPQWIISKLELGKDTQFLHLTCLHLGDETAYQFEDRWINLDALPQAREACFDNAGPNEWLIDTVPYSDVEISFSAAAATPDLADQMGCRPGDPLFLAERATWWQAAPITYVRLYFQRGYKMTTRY